MQGMEAMQGMTADASLPDFADYAGAPEPTPADFASLATGVHADAVPTAALGGPDSARPYTAWYRVWERTTRDDFRLEMYILPFLAVLIVVHVWGTRRNRTKARAWAAAHAPLLSAEFVQVGHRRPQLGEDGSVTVADAGTILKENKADEYTTYATGRQNIAFVDFKLSLAKRYNPLMHLADHALALFFESFPPPQERLEATAYVFDGQEAKIAPAYGKSEAGAKKVASSTFDGFVFAIVHKDTMKRLRDDRYDLSLTTTRDHAKLPLWVTVMSESAEVTDALITPDLVKAVEQAGDDLEALIVSDQPIDQPKTYVVHLPLNTQPVPCHPLTSSSIEETRPRKRISLSLRLPSSPSQYAATRPVFTHFLHLADRLAAHSSFRPEALRRIRATRDDQIAKIRKADEEEKAEERKAALDKQKKEMRDAKLGRLSADEQRKFLEKEREKGMRKGAKRSTVKA